MEKEKKPLMLFEAKDDGSTTEEITQLKDKVAKDGGFILPVSDLADIVHILGQVQRGDLKIEFDISSVDLIGHGSPGEISVGRSVVGAPTSQSKSNGTRHHVLNSDPDAYTDIGPLVTMEKRLLTDTVPLRLLGCQTASDGGPNSPLKFREIDGRVLLFALANMLLCKVQGTTAFISVNDFENGAFTGTLVGFGTKDSVPVTEATAAPAMPAPPLGRKGLPQRKETSTVKWWEIDISRGAISANNVAVSEAKLRAILATCEITGLAYPNGDNYLLAVDVVLKLPSGARLEVLSRGRYCRWVRPAQGDTVLFAVADQDRRFDMVRAVRDAVGELDPWMRSVL